MESDAHTYKRDRLMSFAGRINRRRWALIFVPCFVLGQAAASSGAAFWIGMAFPLFLYATAASVRRAHDIGISAWAPILAVGGVLGLGAMDRLLGAISTMPQPPLLDQIPESGRAIALVGVWVLAMAWIAFLAFLALKPGTDGPNAYGESATGT